MKRSREQERELESITMASYLILIARVTKSQPSTYLRSDHNVFESKTCNRQFQSFQALGGHSPSHKKPRVPVLVTADDQTAENHDSSVKARAHECSVCGLEFATGQALGGHMRRHRAYLHGSDQHRRQDHQPSPLCLSLATAHAPLARNPASSGSSRTLLCLDLNLTPLENGLDVGKVAPIFS